MYEYHCDYCNEPFDPISTRWRCPSCGFKAHCCDGAPLPPTPDRKEK